MESPSSSYRGFAALESSAVGTDVVVGQQSPEDLRPNRLVLTMDVPLQFSAVKHASVGVFKLWSSQVAQFMIPSFLHDQLQSRVTRPRQLRKTSFLDGLRGVTALLVAILHQMVDKPYWYNDPYYSGPYAKGEDPQASTSFVQLPWIRSVYHFGTMVPVFFVISGYVLSYRSIQFIRGPQNKGGVFATGKLAEMLYSSTFRRGFRLFVPSMVGLWYNQVLGMLGIGKTYNYRGSSLWGYVNDYWAYVKLLFSAIWSLDGPRIGALNQFWTIPVEYTCSLALFIVILGTSGLSTKARMFSVAALMLSTLYANHCAFTAFFGGLFLADLEELYVKSAEKELAHARFKNDEMQLFLDRDTEKEEEDTLGHAAKSQSLGLSGIHTHRRAMLIAHNAFWIILFAMATYVLGWPKFHMHRDPIVRWLDIRFGGNRCVYTASLVFVACSFRFKWLQDVFTTRVALYLGDISYSLYITHYALLQFNSKYIASLIGMIFGLKRAGHVNRLVANSFEISLFLVVEVWVADMFWRAVDIPSVKLAKWIEQKCQRAQDDNDD